MASCFANVLKTFTIKQADIMSKSVGVVSEKHAQNINKISSDIDKRFDKLQKAMSKQGQLQFASAEINMMEKEKI